MTRLLALLITILIASLALAEPVTSGVGLFALAYESDHWQKCPSHGPVRCVLGKIPAGESLLLLSPNQSATCLANTAENFDSGWESGSFSLTLVDAKRCQAFAFRLAVKVSAQTEAAYQPLTLASLPAQPESMQREVEVAIRNTASRMTPTNPEHLLALASTKPLIFRLPSMSEKSYLVVFENSQTPGDQVHFLYRAGQIKLIHSAASIASIFVLNGESFIHYTFTCRIGCGYWGSFVVRFYNDSYTLEMFDASTST